MELIVILLSSISGALIGTSVGIYLLYRKLRPITGAELDLTRSKLRSTEFTLASANASVEALKKQLEERDRQITAAEEKARELETGATALRQQVAEQEGKATDEAKAIAESATRQLATYEARVETGEKQAAELIAQVAQLTAELDQLREHLKEESTARTTLESQLTGEHDNNRRLSSRVAELEAERSHFDLTLQEERESAAKGIELLLKAQENFARVFRQAPAEPVPAETNGHSLIAAGVAAGSSNI
jgi:chromosome segregation ATPase